MAETAAHDPDTAAQRDARVSHEHSGFHMPDLNAREWAAILPMIALMVWMGIAPQTFLPPVSAANRNTLERSGLGLEQRVSGASFSLRRASARPVLPAPPLDHHAR